MAINLGRSGEQQLQVVTVPIPNYHGLMASSDIRILCSCQALEVAGGKQTGSSSASAAVRWVNVPKISVFLQRLIFSCLLNLRPLTFCFFLFGLADPTNYSHCIEIFVVIDFFYNFDHRLILKNYLTSIYFVC
jgi:hypothetical protein